MIAGKLADGDFSAGYASWCEACPATLELVRRIEAEGVGLGDLARRAGVAEERIAALIDAERCEHEVVVKLGALYGLTAPGQCPRRAGGPGRAGSP
jgi:hypothetical protein